MGKLIKGVAKVALSPLGAALGMFDKPKAQAPQKERVMAMPDEDALQRAKRRSLTEQVRRAGRSSTILTDDSDTLGG